MRKACDKRSVRRYSWLSAGAVLRESTGVLLQYVVVSSSLQATQNIR